MVARPQRGALLLLSLKGMRMIPVLALLTACGPTLVSDLPGRTHAADELPPIDVRAMGAIGDGSADDSDAIAEALASGMASGAIVYFPPGSYRVTRSLRLAALSGSRLTISAAGAVLLGSEVLDPGVGDEVGVLEVDGDGTADVAIDGISIEHGALTRGVVDGIVLRDLSRANLSGVTATGASRWGVALERVKAAEIGGARLEDNRYGGLGLTASYDVTVEGGSFSRNGTELPVDGYGIALVSNETGPCRRVTVRGVTADGNLRKGLDVHSGHEVLFEGNSVSGFGLSGIYAVNEDIGKDVGDVTIVNNVVDGGDAAQPIFGIDVGAYSESSTPSGTFRIAGNTVRNTSSAASSAIFVRNPLVGGVAPELVVIDGNVIENGAGADAYAIRGTNDDVPLVRVQVTNNIVRAGAALVGIGILTATDVTITGNDVTVDSGASAYGLFASPGATATISGNALHGSFTTPVALFAGQSESGNSLNGAPLP